MQVFDAKMAKNKCSNAGTCTEYLKISCVTFMRSFPRLNAGAKFSCRLLVSEKKQCWW